jgi:hypothetical protein
MWSARAAAAAVAVVVFAGCEGMGTLAPVEQRLPDKLEWSGILQGQQGWQHLSGAVALRWNEGDEHIRVGIAVSGDQPGVVRPWQVARGQCGRAGQLIVTPGERLELSIDDEGTAVVLADIPGRADRAEKYHVRILRSQEASAPVVACADLEPLGFGSPRVLPPTGRNF